MPGVPSYSKHYEDEFETCTAPQALNHMKTLVLFLQGLCYNLEKAKAN